MDDQMTRAAVVLLSGGIDSATCLAIAREEGFRPYALTFRYGQRHAAEVRAAWRVARAAGCPVHRVVPLDLRWIGGSTLTGPGPVPKDRDAGGLGRDVPSTYVPARNTIFLAVALAYAEVLGASDIYIGANAVDYSGYPDCRAAFLGAFERAANLATRATVEWQQRLVIHAPLIDLRKAQIIQRGTQLGVDYSLTHSCYDPTPAPRGAGVIACGRCDACTLRLAAFEKAGVPDLIAYPDQPARYCCQECGSLVGYEWPPGALRPERRPRRCPTCRARWRTAWWGRAAAQRRWGT